MKKTILLVLVALILLSGTALAAVYVYKANFTCQVTVETGTPGLSVAPTQYDFGIMAIGDWSQQKMMTVKNIGMEAIVSLYFETDAPDGLGFYAGTPPIMPLLPGQEITSPVSLKADDALPPGSYTIVSKVIGVK